MLMIKNTYFCVAKVMADNPDGCCWIILLRTDRLEELFGILQTIVGIEIWDAGSKKGARSQGTSWQTSADTLDVPTIIYNIYI